MASRQTVGGYQRRTTYRSVDLVPATVEELDRVAAELSELRGRPVTRSVALAALCRAADVRAVFAALPENVSDRAAAPAA